MVFGGGSPFGGALGSVALGAEALDGGEGFFLSSSAHDLGTALTGDGISCSELDTGPASPAPASVVFFIEFVRLSAFDSKAGFVASEVTLAVVLFGARESIGRLGMAGIMGIDEIIGRAELEALGVVCCGGAVDEGVVGCVDITSDGGCDVGGVSRLVVTTDVFSVEIGLSGLGAIWGMTSSASVDEYGREGSSTETADG